METAGLPSLQGGEQSGVRSRELGNASTANQRAFDGASGLEMAHFPAAQVPRAGQAKGGGHRRLEAAPPRADLVPRRASAATTDPPPPSFRPRPASGCRCGASGACGGRGNLGTWESGELPPRGGRGRGASFPGSQIPRLRAESGLSTSPNGHLPSYTNDSYRAGLGSSPHGADTMHAFVHLA
jgi:hypothetical protein